MTGSMPHSGRMGTADAARRTAARRTSVHGPGAGPSHVRGAAADFPCNIPLAPGAVDALGEPGGAPAYSHWICGPPFRQRKPPVQALPSMPHWFRPRKAIPSSFPKAVPIAGVGASFAQS